MTSSTAIERSPAADVSQEEWQARVDRAYELDQQIKTGVLAGRVAWWATASAVYEFHQMSGVTVLRGAETSVEEYCADPDLALSRQQYQEYFNAWRQVELSGLSLEDVKDVPYANLVRMFRAINDGKLTFRKALDEARSLSQSDIREKYTARPKPALSGQPDARKSDPTEGLKAAGPDEGTGDEVGEPDADPNLATSGDPLSGHDEPPTDADEEEQEAYIRDRVQVLGESEVTFDSDDSEDAAEWLRESENAPKPVADPEPHPDVHIIGGDFRAAAARVVEAMAANPNPRKNVPKAIREAIEALAPYVS